LPWAFHQQRGLSGQFPDPVNDGLARQNGPEALCLDRTLHGHEMLGPLRCHPIVQLIPSPRMIPATGFPIWRSNTGRQGTSVKSRLRSTSA